MRQPTDDTRGQPNVDTSRLYRRPQARSERVSRHFVLIVDFRTVRLKSHHFDHLSIPFICSLFLNWSKPLAIT